MPATVVVTAATSPLGWRVCALAAADPDVGLVRAVDHPDRAASLAELAAPGGPNGAVVEAVAVELGDPELKRACEGATVIVHLGDSAPLDDPAAALDGTGSTVGAVHSTRDLLSAAAAAGVRTLVVLSSAMVYGAWPGNPVPLTEDAPLRPAPDLPFAVGKAEVERLVAEWRTDQPDGTTIAVLRPTIAVGPESEGWLGRSPWRPTGVQPDDTEPPSQYVHLDDVASAVDHARRSRLDGPFNVAPDGWIPAEGLRELSGRARRLPLPAAMAEAIAKVRWRIGLTGTPPSVLPYTMYSWVVANDRLEATGWRPAHTNEMAYVEADPGGPLANVGPRSRQLLSLGVIGAGAAALIIGTLALVRRIRHRL